MADEAILPLLPRRRGPGFQRESTGWWGKLSAMSFSDQVRRPRTWFIAVPVMILLAVTAGPFIYFNVIQDDAPERLDFSDITTTTAAGSAAPSDNATVDSGSIDGSWEVTDGSEAGWRATEVLFGQTNEAAGRTEDVTGTLVIEGTTATAISVEVDLTTVTSDEERRDGQVQDRILETASFPTAFFEVTEPVDFGEVPADLEEVTVSATGEMTIHGVTQVITVDLNARRNGGKIEVTGTIPVTWADYDISDPSGGPAQVEDSGEIEFALNFAPAG